MGTAEDLKRLGRLVTSRRAQLGISKDEAARRAGMSNVTWKRIQDGLPVRDTSYAKVDAVLHWPPGTSLAIANGSTDDPLASEVTGDVRITRLPDAEDSLRTAVQDAVITTAPDLTGTQIRAIGDRVIEELRRRGVLPDDPQTGASSSS
ncbi:helix-turn-helix domain-containing protein [Streptacidiphilus sp. MAP12-20]|uniref:helix-turn-helix domain-containing protein n=1 Tax=Streptacidiphilus sp. MAP12-20 TaxID=3156299 RepID=UPI003514B449